ncbi:MAG: tRNA (adenosine(37)-N6)-threonylcarbamoyltransferase complex dimerization subunit type 1 TsaB [Pseudomonadota bacterium]
MTILAIDTCANLCAAALFGKDGVLRSRACEDIGRGHGARLLAVVDEALSGASTALSDLSRVIVTVGPGSFTGIRVGVATARGYGVALRIPVNAVTTFALMNLQTRAEQACSSETVIAIAGGRGQAFVMRYAKDGGEMGSPASIELENASSVELPEGAVLVGNAAHLLDPKKTRQHALAECATGDISFACHAAQLFPREPEPLYIRAADAKPQSKFALPRMRVET